MSHSDSFKSPRHGRRCQRFDHGTPLSEMVTTMMRQQKESLQTQDEEEDDDGQFTTPTTTTALGSPPSYLTVVSYNLLAPLYVRSVDHRTGQIQPFAAFEWVTDDDILNWDLRQQRLLRDLTNCDADVICLQEVELQKKQRKFNTDKTDVNDEEYVWDMPDWIQPLLVKEEEEDPCQSNSGSNNHDVDSDDKKQQNASSLNNNNNNSYRAILPIQSELEKIAERNQRVLGVEAAITVAVLVKQTRSASSSSSLWEIVATPSDPEQHHVHSNNTVSVCLQRQQQESDDDNNEDPPLVVVTSVHLDAKDETKRVAQITKAFQSSRAMLNQYYNNYSKNKQRQSDETQQQQQQQQQKQQLPLTMIMAGDYNVEFLPGSCLKSFLQPDDNAVEEDDRVLQQACTQAHRFFDKDRVLTLEQWKQLHQHVKNVLLDYCITDVLGRVDTGPTRCAYDDECDDEDNELTPTLTDTIETSQPKRMANWKLDHFLYTMDRLVPIAQWKTLDFDPESCKLGLPNHKHATSDHLPIACVFEFVERSGRLDKAKKTQLAETLRNLIATQQSAQAALQSQSANERLQIEAAMAMSATPRVENTLDDDSKNINNKKSKKKTKSKPPPEIIAFLRKSRAASRQLLQQQLAERQDLIDCILREDDFPMSALFFIEGLVSLPWRKWVKEGGGEVKTATLEGLLESKQYP